MRVEGLSIESHEIRSVGFSVTADSLPDGIEKEHRRKRPLVASVETPSRPAVRSAASSLRSWFTRAVPFDAD